MRRLEKELSEIRGDPEALREPVRYPEDTAAIRAAHEGLKHAQPVEVEALWCVFSDSEYCAGFLHVEQRRLSEFREWLEQDVSAPGGRS